MRQLAIDIETYSSENLSESGVYRYSSAPDFAVLLFAYAVDGGAVQITDIASGETLPDEVLAALTDPAVTKTAWNAAFERVCLSRFLGIEGYLDPRQWQCTMVRSARAGLPLSLGQCAEVLRLPQGKMTEGRALIRYFSMPSANGIRHMPADDPERWATFKAYCIRDVEVEQALLRRLMIPVPEFERELYVADQLINDRGVKIDLALVQNAERFDRELTAEIMAEMRRLTGVENPASPAQLKEYLRRSTGLSVASLNKSSLDEVEENLQFYPEARRVMALRRLAGKTSNRKYRAMLQSVCPDGRIRGLLQFYGAARTGRWAGRLVQVQNLPQNHIDDIDRARSLVRAGDAGDFSLNYESPTQTLSELIRTAFVAREGCTFHVCDFSAIEARVIAWLAGEDWVLDVFRQGGDIYCATASQMFHCPVEKHGVNAHLRQKGKIAVLALGYGGGAAALDAMGAGRMGMSESEERDIVGRWRKANPCIVKLWQTLERAAICALAGYPSTVNRGLSFSMFRGCLCVELPSGRTIFYPRARAVHQEDAQGHVKSVSVEYEGLNQTTGKWTTLRTYGGKLTENIVQAIARDILGEVILRARDRGLEIVMHIHDEIVVEAPHERTLSEVEALFADAPAWCSDLPLKGAGYSTPYYLKD